MIGWFIFILGLCWTTTTTNAADDNVTKQCPNRCLCFATTVRCMFLQLDKIPEVSPETTTLDLRFNRIKQIPVGTFDHLTNLTTLLMNNNFLTNIDQGTFLGLINLRYLYLYKNRIRHIESGAFQGLLKLEQLYLHFNELDNLRPNTFQNLTNLDRLFLHHNHLTKVPAEAFGDIVNLKRLRLDSNPLICDCKILWLAKVLAETQRTKLSAAVICDRPSEFQGKSLASVHRTSFKCTKPILMEEPNDLEITFGSTLSFTCKADGQPEPEILWLHNNKEMDGDGRHTVLDDGTLMIEDAQETDQGYYQCTAKNQMGEVKSRRAKIKRHAGNRDKLRKLNPRRSQTDRSTKRPKFIVTPSDQLVHRGDVINLRCQALGDPEPVISWIKDNNILINSQRIQTSPLGAMTIQDAEPTDSGTYRCVASNKLGKVSTSIEIVVQAPPVFTEEPTDQILATGERATFTCRADGDPAPSIAWFRKGVIITSNDRITLSPDGTNVILRDVDKSDQTTYLCRAQNIAGTRDTGANLIIRDQASPVFITKPEDQKVSIGERAVFSCLATGDPQPTIEWRRSGETVLIGGRRTFHSGGTLSISGVVPHDAGTYECWAENGLGSSTAVANLKVTNGDNETGPLVTGSDTGSSTGTGAGSGTGSITGSGTTDIDDNDVRLSVEEARRNVNAAVNHTLTELFDKNRKNRTPSDLLRLVRFPTPNVQEVIKSAEIYEQALILVRRYIQTGKDFNLSNDEYFPADFMSPFNLQLMANLSGCLVHRRLPQCTDMCFHSHFRSYNGSCNNLHHPLWGASEIALRRLLRPAYENNFNTPIGWNVGRPYNDFQKPSARLVSTSIIRTQTITPDETFTHMLMQWGQFLDHDLDMAPPTVSTESFLDGTDCKTSCINAPPCFPIPIPKDDHRIRTSKCMEFVRSSAVCGSGSTSVLYGKVAAREQLNILTSYIDASQVYGSSEPEAFHLRSRVHGFEGKLREGISTESGKALLPFADDSWPTDCRRDSRESGVGCFVAGDIRVNEQLALTAMHTIFFREHNRLVDLLKNFNPTWDGDRLYQEARKIVGAQMQHITYSHWLPNILGPSGMDLLGPYRGYDPTIEATISNEFATAALRFGHTLINPILQRLDSTFKPIPQGHVHLRNAFFSPFRILEEGGIDPLLRGLFATPAKLKKPDQLLNSELTEQLFRQVNQIALDLAAINIQRGRDHGLPSYTEYRRFCNLSIPGSFDDLRDDIQNQELRDKLEEVYGHPGNIDLWVGGVCEDVVEGAKVGPTFLCILVDQFNRLRSGDRFYYENPGVFRPDQLVQLKRTSLSRIMCDNGDSIKQATLDAFLVPTTYGQCEEIPREDYLPWLECCQGCHKGTLDFWSRRQKRQIEESFEEVIQRLEKSIYRLNKKVMVLESQCLDDGITGSGRQELQVGTGNRTSLLKSNL